MRNPLSIASNGYLSKEIRTLNISVDGYIFKTHIPDVLIVEYLRFISKITLKFDIKC